MKYILIALLLSMSFFSASFADDESGCYDYDCGLSDSAYDPKPESTWQELTYDELAGLGALPPDDYVEMAYVPETPSTGCTAFECDDSAFPAAGETVVSSEEAEDAVAEKGAAFLAQNHKCEPCEIDEAVANLTAGEADRAPASAPACEMTDEDNNCVDSSGGDSGGGSI